MLTYRCPHPSHQGNLAPLLEDSGQLRCYRNHVYFPRKGVAHFCLEDLDGEYFKAEELPLHYYDELEFDLAELDASADA